MDKIVQGLLASEQPLSIKQSVSDFISSQVIDSHLADQLAVQVYSSLLRPASWDNNGDEVLFRLQLLHRIVSKANQPALRLKSWSTLAWKLAFGTSNSLQPTILPLRLSLLCTYLFRQPLSIPTNVTATEQLHLSISEMGHPQLRALGGLLESIPFQQPQRHLLTACLNELTSLSLQPGTWGHQRILRSEALAGCIAAVSTGPDLWRHTLAIVFGLIKESMATYSICALTRRTPSSVIAEISSLTLDLTDAEFIHHFKVLLQWLRWPVFTRKPLLLFLTSNQAPAAVGCQAWVLSLLGSCRTNSRLRQLCLGVLQEYLPLLVMWLQEPLCEQSVGEVLSQCLLYLSHEPNLVQAAFNSLLQHPHLEALLQRQPALSESLCAVAQSQQWTLPSSVIVHDERVASLKEKAWTVHGNSSSGPPGIVNLGNTCYLNAILQALGSTSIHSAFSSSQKARMGNVMATSLGQLAISNDIEAWRRLVPLLRPAYFREGAQQDAAEFCEYLIDTTREENKSIAPDPLELCLRSEEQATVCEHCSTRTTVSSKQSTLRLTLSGGVEPLALPNLIHQYYESVQLSGENQFACSVCEQKQDACQIITTVGPWPKVLLVVLNRFSYSPSGGAVKLATRVQLEMSLVLQNNEYELKAIVVHSGKFLSTGHYTAYGKRNSVWYLFNDSFVQPVSWAKIAGLQNLDTPYVLMYELTSPAANEHQ